MESALKRSRYDGSFLFPFQQFGLNKKVFFPQRFKLNKPGLSSVELRKTSIDLSGLKFFKELCRHGSRPKQDTSNYFR